MADVLSESGVGIGVPMRLRLPVLLISAALLAAACAPSAQANLGGSFHLKTGTAQTPGRAKASGRVTFVGTGQPYYQARVSGSVNDLCPGDGYSAVLEINYQFGDGTSRRRLITDPNGCQAAATSFSVKSKRFKKKLASIALVLDEVDHDANGIPVDYGDQDRQVFYPFNY